MKTLSDILFWTLAAFLVLPAIVGVVLAIAVVTVVAMLAFTLSLVALGVACVSCVPIVWWCALCESAATQAVLARIRAQNQQTTEN